jgi:hypothetical protein
MIPTRHSFALAAGLLLLGCNTILGNQARSLAESSGGGLDNGGSGGAAAGGGSSITNAVGGNNVGDAGAGAAMSATGGSNMADGGGAGESDNAGNGGSGPGTGGTSTGGTSTGGASTGGASTGGASGATGSGGASGTVPGTLITDGDFSQGLGPWHVTALNGTAAAPTVADGMVCFGIVSYQTIVLGWPMDNSMGVPLSVGSYVLSYSASVSGAPSLQILAKVGPTNGGTDFQSTDTLSSSQLQTFHDIGMADPDGGDPNAGVAFVVTDTATTNGNVCFANISLTPAGD